MFIKRDHRKVEEILLSDPEAKVEELLLSKRKAEFNHNINILCKESMLTAMSHLKLLNLYDNSLQSLTGIDMLQYTPIEEINLGMNELTSLPTEFGQISTLQVVWLDDNQFELFPSCLFQLINLKALRLSNNMLHEVPPMIESLDRLEILALDNNEIIDFPNGLLSLKGLKQLWLRQNKIEILPHNLSALESLETFSISSNRLSSLPDNIWEISKLKCLYINGNKLTSISLPADPKHEVVINAANNGILELPSELTLLDVKNGVIVHNLVNINLFGNPCAKGVEKEKKRVEELL